MQFLGLACLFAAIISAPVYSLSADPAPTGNRDAAQYENYCCFTGCSLCTANTCNTGCNSIFYSICCAEGFRNVTESGEVHIFNADGKRMYFVNQEPSSTPPPRDS
ncbi:hypothetical protein F5Y11DRAFT_349931 [Daldinia sp. FL1419]|nr:hypothetical protein F5Y11DRAFT_349931 [Daldinia sp. FL1419]